MMESTLPFVSVIVPVLNGERTIKDCVVSLLRTHYPPERREILVVDNGSTDRTAEIVQAYPVTLLREENRGVAAARNRGIEASRGEVLAFTDADCVVTSGWLRELVGGFEDATTAGVAGDNIPAYLPVTPAERYAARVGSHTSRTRLNSPLSPFVDTANVAFRHEVFQRIGFFDTRFPAMEDIDFSWRFFQEADMKLRYNPRAIVFHRPRSTAWGFFSQHFGYGRGLAILQRKYPKRLPWSWWQELRAWGDAGRFAWFTARAAIRYALRGGEKTDIDDAYFTFLRKLAVRQGYLWGMLVRGNR
jgi:O-antigen biosynthesis protein